MKDNENNRDQELDAMLDALRIEEPKVDDIDHWSTAVDDELATNRFDRSGQTPRIIEWAIAASVGFFVALAFGKISTRPSSVNEHEDMSNPAQEIYSGVDATEMKLIAIHE